jgi:small GTP-binding protein
MVENYRIAVVGDRGVGKTLFLRTFTQNYYEEEYDPTIDENYRKQFTVDDHVMLLELEDSIPNEFFPHNQQHPFHQIAQGWLILFSITDRQSFYQTSWHRDEIFTAQPDCPPIVLVGTKLDLELDRQVTTKEAESLANDWCIPFLEATSKEIRNLDEVFYVLLRQMRVFWLLRASTRKNKGSSMSKCMIM